jgi:hypothetical protein
MHLVVAVVVVLAVVGSLAAPDDANADFLGIDLNPAHWALDGFKAIIEWIFGDLTKLAEHLIQFLLAIPLLADAGQFPQLNAYRSYVVSGAWGILGLSFTISSLRYWLSSYTGSGAFEALTGFARSAVAIVLLLIWPVGIDKLIRFTNAFTVAISNPVVGHNLSRLVENTLGGALAADGGIGLIVGIAALIMGLVLLIIKVIVTALLAVLFVIGPLAIALWPIDELSWALRNLVQAMLALLMFPMLWAVCFGTFAVVAVDTLLEGHGLGNKLLAPLFGLASLIVAFRLPFVVLRQAMNAGLAPSISRAMQGAYYARGLAGMARGIR